LAAEAADDFCGVGCDMACLLTDGFADVPDLESWMSAAEIPPVCKPVEFYIRKTVSVHEYSVSSQLLKISPVWD